jgi:hypothetical protein
MKIFQAMKNITGYISIQVESQKKLVLSGINAGVRDSVSGCFQCFDQSAHTTAPEPE